MKLNKNELIKELKKEGFSEVRACSLGPNFNSGEHKHEELTVHIILEGELTVIDSKSKSKKVYKLGDRVDFPKGTIHTSIGSKENLIIIVGVKK